MKSKISFFNKTIFLKNVTLYWPIWVVYTLFLLGALPVSLWFSMQYRYDTTAISKENMIWELYYVIRPSYYIWVIIFAAVIIGMALFSYLYKSQSANMIHSMPVDRTELFGTNVISGLAFLIVPQIVSFVLALFVCLDYGIARVEYLAMWLLIVVAAAIIVFALVTFCAFFTGQLVALPIYVVTIHCIAYAINYIIQLVVTLIGYGVSTEGLLSDEIIIWFSPYVCLLSNVDIFFTRDDYGEITGLELGGIPCIIIYLVVAVVLYGIAYLLYRNRKLEQAGDLITVEIIKPIFRWGVGTICGFYVTIFFTALFADIGFGFSIISFAIRLLLFGVIFYFVADMFVRKTFRVFKKQNWKGCGRFSAVLLLSFAVMVIYANVEEKRVPDVDDVESASINMGYLGEYTSKDIEKVIDIHEKIVENVDYYEKLDNSGFYSNYAELIGIEYNMKDGSSVRRDYYIPYEDDGKEIIDQIKLMEDDPETFLCYLLGSNYKDEREFFYGNLYFAAVIENKEGEKYVKDISLELDTSQCEEFYHAIIQDGLEGRLNKYNTYYSTDYDEELEMVSKNTYTVTLEMEWSEPSEVEAYGGYYAQGYKYAHVEFGSDCVNIINAIVGLGIEEISSPENIYWGE